MRAFLSFPGYRVMMTEDEDEKVSSSLRKSPSASQICPTCRGNGYLNEKESSELVALIPYKDRRLKPSRTKCYVFIGVCLTVLVSFLLVFFLFPRSLHIQLSHGEFYAVPQDNATNPTDFRLGLKLDLKISNENFYVASAKDVKVEIEFKGSGIVLLGSSRENVNVTLGMRESKMVKFSLLLVFTGKSATYAQPICNGVSFKKSLDVIVSVMAEFKYLSQDQSISQRHPLSIDCILRG
eukprot:m.152764 g.152764  ORF g.152764 m.152764 type:complete len:238 (+) comp38606_c0_seq15:93-806(+)